MKKQIVAAIFLGIVIFCAGCGDSGQQYVDLDNIETDGEDKQTEEISGYDTAAYFDVFINVSSNERYIYGGLSGTQQSVDMSEQTYSFLCSRVGCNHRFDDACELNQERACLRHYDGGLLYVSEDSLYFRSSYGELRKIHTNKYSTEFSEKNYPATDEEPWRPYGIAGFIFLNEQKLLISAYNYVYIYDLKSEKYSEPIEICDSLIIGLCVNGNKVYSYNMNGEGYLTDIDSKTSERILEQGRGMKFLNGRLWYSVWVDGKAQICSNNVGLTDERIEVSEGQVSFIPCRDGVIYETKRENGYTVILHSFEGEDRELLNTDTDEITYSAQKDGYEYNCNGMQLMTHIDGKLYVCFQWDGYGSGMGEHDEAFVWYCVTNGEITELAGE